MSPSHNTPTSGRRARARALFRTGTLRSSVRPAKRLLATVILGLGIAAPIALTSPSLASASATGCTSFGQHTILGHTIPSGYMCATVQGSGTYVQSFNGNFQLAGSMCNYRFLATFYTNAGSYVTSVATPTSNTCTWDQQTPIGAAVSRNLPPGRVVIALQSAGQTIASITEYIHS